MDGFATARGRGFTRMALAVGCSLALGFVAAVSYASDVSPSMQSGQVIAENGSTAGVPACSSCHGADGEGAAEVGIPRLAGASELYLERELDAFRDGIRTSPVMSQYARALTPQQVASVSAYYASLPVPVLVEAAPEALEQGHNIALNGNLAIGLPSCASCHGSHGEGLGTAPPLAGQSEAYVSEELTEWKQGERAEGPDFFMSLISAKLTAADIDRVSAYYASLPVHRTGEAQP